MLEWVSVPCRGYLFLNCIQMEGIKGILQPFPSPVGVIYFSIKSNTASKSANSFPSPVGVIYFSIIIV